MRDESILYVPSAESYYVLNPSAAALWEALQTPSDETTLTEILCERFDGITPDRALTDVRATLEEMRSLALIEETTAPNAVS